MEEVEVERDAFMKKVFVEGRTPPRKRLLPQGISDHEETFGVFIQYREEHPASSTFLLT